MTFPAINNGGSNGSLLNLPPTPSIRAGDDIPQDSLEASEKQLLADKNLQILKKVFGIRGPNRFDMPSSTEAAPASEQRNVSVASEASLRFSMEIEQVSATSLTITNGDGSTININVLRASRLSVSGEINLQQGEETKQKDPLVIDLDGDGIETSGVDNGVLFDIDGDGRNDITSVASGGDGMLAIDLNNNGKIDSGRELFGDQNGYANGFEALKALDSNNDNRIDASDAFFDRLRVLSFNNNHQQLNTLGEASIKSIDLNYRNVAEQLNNGDDITQRSSVTFENNQQGQVADVLFNYR